VEARTADLSSVNRHLQREVEERERIEGELRSAKLVAEKASAAKSAFLANTTHEIRTPLTSILGYADLLLDGGMTEEQRDRYVLVLRQNASHLLKMIDDLLDLSRIETGNLRLTLDDYSPMEIAEQTLELLRPRATEKGLILSLDLEGQLPSTVRTDGVRLRQVLLNLLSNAIKFTPSGRVALAVHGAGGEDGSGMRCLQFDVVDTGIGIEAEHRALIFEPFYQVEQGENRRHGGTGLGLAISRKLVEQMGGTLEVSSELGRGSVFKVRIPVLLPSKVSQQSTQMVHKESRIEGHVLLAEDNTNIRWLVEEYLRRAGATVTAVSDGIQAVEAARQAIEGQRPFDLILLDISMPGMDGGEAMQRIREGGYTGPVVALTAHSASDEKACFDMPGWDAVAAKPINRHTFIPLIARLIDERRQATVQQ
jgi:signal transduction histidine kinase/CheY-like chemotaxis protein